MRRNVVACFSLLLFVAVYSIMMGIGIGIGLTVLLLIHEVGHMVAIRYKGYPSTGLPIFVPFIGAAIDPPKGMCRHNEAFIAFGGPLVGTMASINIATVFIVNRNPIWIELSMIGIIMNFINMIPISPFDGGRITQAVQRGFMYKALVPFLVITALFVGMGHALILCAIGAFVSIKYGDSDELNEIHREDLSASKKSLWLLLWIGLIAVQLAWMRVLMRIGN